MSWLLEDTKAELALPSDIREDGASTLDLEFRGFEVKTVKLVLADAERSRAKHSKSWSRESWVVVSAKVTGNKNRRYTAMYLVLIGTHDYLKLILKLQQALLGSFLAEREQHGREQLNTDEACIQHFPL
ncbi:hypothetical protein EDD15DRAFT_2375118 [Pisolithus albus]|nr:hypothetical protein EDD15DRAFT_2375118 [Pisolithus albus]